MTERKVPEDLAALEAQLADVERRVQRRIDPGTAALGVSVAVLALVGSLLLTWSGAAQGWEVLAGVEPLGPLPRLFAYTATGFGVAGSAAALATRWWALAWVCAVGCGFSVLAGVWAIWSRQVAVPEGGTGPGFGLVLAVLAVLVLAVAWVRIALRR